VETFNKKVLENELGYSLNFVQDNQSVSHKYVLRGLHFQNGAYSQAKIVRVVQGRILDVIVDLRTNSATFGEHLTLELSNEKSVMLFLPKGIAHGFLALEDNTIFTYKCDEYYHPESEGGIIYNDPDLGIDWGISAPNLILSEKDLQLPRFKELSL
jgi:dTDP-4-dehydrorhamnose 3,5-epimerase